MDALTTLKELHDTGFLDAQEYKTRKDAIIDKITGIVSDQYDFGDTSLFGPASSASLDAFSDEFDFGCAADTPMFDLELPAPSEDAASLENSAPCLPCDPEIAEPSFRTSDPEKDIINTYNNQSSYVPKENSCASSVSASSPGFASDSSVCNKYAIVARIHNLDNTKLEAFVSFIRSVAPRLLQMNSEDECEFDLREFDDTLIRKIDSKLLELENDQTAPQLSNFSVSESGYETVEILDESGPLATSHQTPPQTSPVQITASIPDISLQTSEFENIRQSLSNPDSKKRILPCSRQRSTRKKKLKTGGKPIYVRLNEASSKKETLPCTDMNGQIVDGFAGAQQLPNGKFLLHVEVYDTREAKKKYPCEALNCNKSFQDKSNYIKHLRIHTREKPYDCDMCDKSFAHLATLKEHKNTHYKVFPFACPECDKGFSSASNLTRHKRIHTGEKPFVCSVCTRGFAQSGNLKSHLRKVHHL